MTCYNTNLECLTPAAQARFVSERLRSTLLHAYAHAPAVRRLLDAAGVAPADVQGVADLAAVPITRKDDLIDLQAKDPPFGGFAGVPLTRMRRLFRSPGPLYDPEGDKPDYWRWAQALWAAGLRDGDIVLNTVAYQLTPLGFMFDSALRVLGCGIVPAGPGNTEVQVTFLRDFPVTAYVGLPSYLLAILHKAEELGLDPRRLALNKAFVAAEPFPPSLRQALADYGVSARQGYGTADAGNLGYECERADGMHVPLDVVVEFVDINTGQGVAPGEPGEVVVTLLEETYPLLRFGTGDLAIYTDEPCPCGRTTRRITGIVGRVGQAVKVRGMFVHPRQAAVALHDFAELARWQLVVTRAEHHDDITLYAVLRPGAAVGPAWQETVAAALRTALKVRVDVALVDDAAVPADAAPLVDRRVWE